jgi:hypothetical protein
MINLDLEQEDEYVNRVFYWKLDYKGSLWIPTNVNFHPTLWKGTEKEFDKICKEHLFCHEDEFKVIGWHKFDSIEKYNEKYNIEKWRNQK